MRDLLDIDIVDYQRWFTSEQEWTKWDAPWEIVDESFAKGYISLLSERILIGPPEIRTRFEICYQYKHIGWVSSYHIDHDKDQLAVGINITETDCWGIGLGKEVLELWISYLLESKDIPYIHCETWSGNERMVKLALGLGFEIIEKDRTITINDNLYYRYKFKLMANSFYGPDVVIPGERDERFK